MYKCIVLLLVLMLGINMLAAQEDEYYVEDSDTLVSEESVEVEQSPLILNKYIVALISLAFIAALYYLFLSFFPRVLEKGENPLAGAATQCMKFALASACVILLALFALSGFVFSNLKDTFIANLGFLIFIGLVWFVYFVVTISNKNKGGSNAR